MSAQSQSSNKYIPKSETNNFTLPKKQINSPGIPLLDFKDFNLKYPSFEQILLIANKSVAVDSKFVKDNLATITRNSKSYDESDDSDNTDATLLYEVYLTYMYEGSLNEEQYWQVLIETSTPQGLRDHATKVGRWNKLLFIGRMEELYLWNCLIILIITINVNWLPVSKSIFALRFVEYELLYFVVRRINQDSKQHTLRRKKKFSITDLTKKMY